jgi:hypothetical protein
VALDQRLETQRVPLSALKPAPWNPRLIRDARFKQLCRSLEADPDFLWERPGLATQDGTVYAGNMRYRAAEHLQWDSIPTRYADIPEQLAKERALRDNNQFGEWQDEELAELLYSLQQSGSAVEDLGFNSWQLESLLGSVTGDAVSPESVTSEWQGMPEFEQQNAMPQRTIYVHFADDAAVEDFSRLVGQRFTEKTKDIWYPEQKPQSRIHEQYVSDES